MIISSVRLRLKQSLVSPVFSPSAIFLRFRVPPTVYPFKAQFIFFTRCFFSKLFLVFFFSVPLIGIFGGAVVPLYKGMMSQMVEPSERGKSAKTVSRLLCNRQ